jgi:excisionase family DNA binding protein
MAYTLTEAATAAGVSRSTIFRAIKTGRISATRTDGGNFTIEPAELHRVFPPAPAMPVTHASNGAMNHGAMPLGTADTGHVVQLESEIKALRDMSALLREQLHETRDTVDDLRRDRDAWRSQAQQLALPKPATEPARRWWPWRRAG